MTRYLAVIGLDLLASAFQGRDDLPAVSGGVPVKIQHLQPRCKALYDFHVGLRVFRLLSPFDQLHQRNGADAQLTMVAPEGFTHLLRTVFVGQSNKFVHFSLLFYFFCNMSRERENKGMEITE